MSIVRSTIFILKVNFLGYIKRRAPNEKQKGKGPPVPHQRSQTDEHKTLSPKTQLEPKPQTPNHHK